MRKLLTFWLSLLLMPVIGVGLAWAQGAGIPSGGGGSGTVSSCATTNAVGVFASAGTTIGCDANTTDAAGVWIMTLAGALSTPTFTMSGAPIATGGTGTTTVPLFYQNTTGATAPSTWSTAGTFQGINAPSGFTGNFVDYHLNGGASLFSVNATTGLFVSSAISSSSNISTGTVGGSIIVGSGGVWHASGRSQMGSGADGEIFFQNNASTGFSRVEFEASTTAWPDICPETGTVPILAFDLGGGCSAGTFTKTAQTLQVTGADVTCGSGGTLTPCTAFTTITGLTAALPTIATNWSFQCDLIVSQATAAAADQIGVQTATNASTNLAASGIAYTAAAVSTAGAVTTVSSTSAQSIVTFTPGATGTKLPIHISGTIEGTSTSGTTFNLQVLTGAGADLLTVYRGSACWLY